MLNQVTIEQNELWPNYSGSNTHPAAGANVLHILVAASCFASKLVGIRLLTISSCALWPFYNINFRV